MPRLVMIRHGESEWNKENRFTGWVDVGLSEKGAREALEGGRALKRDGYAFDVAHTSVLKRAIKTLWIVLEEMDLMWIPVRRSWRLNERHYGALQGLDKAETAARHGEAQVKIWRRSYDIPPPPLPADDPGSAARDPRYRDLQPGEIPRSESLKDTVARLLPCWHDGIAPDLRAGKRVLVAAHGNSIRALVKHLDAVPDAEIAGLNIPTGIPLVYDLDAGLEPVRHFYLADPARLAEALEAVEAQGKAKTGGQAPLPGVSP